MPNYGLVECPPSENFRRFVEDGFYGENWGCWFAVSGVERCGGKRTRVLRGRGEWWVNKWDGGQCPPYKTFKFTAKSHLTLVGFLTISDSLQTLCGRNKKRTIQFQ